MKKRSLIVTLLATAGLLLILIFSGAYAVITLNTSTQNVNLEANISSPLSFTSQGGDKLAMNIETSKMQAGASNNVVASTSDNVILTLDTDGLEGICCSYDFTWVWDPQEKPSNQYHLTSGATKEYVLTSSFVINYLDKESNANISLPGSSSQEVQIPNYSTTPSVLFSGELCNINNAVLSSRVTQNYAIKTEFYNLEQNQDHIRGASFAGKLQVGNISCHKAS